MLFPTETARGVWTERWCDNCYHPDEVARREHYTGPGCPIVAKAIASDRKPPQWDRNARAQTMDAAYKCNAFLAKPPVARRGTVPDETLPLFGEDELTPGTRHLVPIEGWPDYRAQGIKTKGGEHA